MFQSGSPTGGLCGLFRTLRAGSSVWSSSTSNASMSSSGRALAAYLPHMGPSVCRGADTAGPPRSRGAVVAARLSAPAREGLAGAAIVMRGYVDTVGPH